MADRRREHHVPCGASALPASASSRCSSPQTTTTTTSGAPAGVSRRASGTSPPTPLSRLPRGASAGGSVLWLSLGDSPAQRHDDLPGLIGGGGPVGQQRVEQ